MHHDTVALDNSENFPPTEVAAEPCAGPEKKSKLHLNERGALGLQQMDSVPTTPTVSSHAHKTGENQRAERLAHLENLLYCTEPPQC